MTIRVDRRRASPRPRWSPTWPRAGAPVAPDRGGPADPRRRLPQPDRPQPAREPAKPPPSPPQTADELAARDRARSQHEQLRHRHRQRDEPRAEAGAARAVLGAVRDGPAAGLPRAVRAAAARGPGRLRAAVVRARHRRDDLPVRHVDDRLQPDRRDADRLARADAGHAAAPVLAAGRPRAQGDRADARADRDHRRRRDAVRLRPAPRRGPGRRADPRPVLRRDRRRCPTRWRWSRRTRSGCSGPSSRRCSSRCCCSPACCCRSRAHPAGCRSPPT